jgi:transcription elongation factor Elf1
MSAEPLVIEHAQCPFCNGPQVGALRRDKKGRPYYSCGACGTRVFIHDPRVYSLFKFMLQTGHSLYAESTRQGFHQEVPHVLGA